MNQGCLFCVVLEMAEGLFGRFKLVFHLVAVANLANPLKDNLVVRSKPILDQINVIHFVQDDDIYLIKKGLDAHDRIVLEGIRQVRDGDEVEYEFESGEQALSHLKYHAE